MGSMYFQLARLEESSSQQRLVIVLWPPADLLITWRAPQQRRHSPTLLLLRLPGVEGGSWQRHQRTWLQEEEEGLHHPCPLPQHRAMLCAGPGPCLYKGVLGAEKDKEESKDSLGR